MTDFVVERLDVSDAADATASINELLSELTTTGRTTTARDILETLKSCRILVVRERSSSRIVGMGTISKMKQLGRSYSVIDDVVVLSSHRGRGIFTLLMDALEDVARKDFGVVRIELHTSRQPAAARYKKRGYHLHDGGIYRKSL